jgi:hypothetical protein
MTQPLVSNPDQFRAEARVRRVIVALVFVYVLATQLLLVALAGTDVPFHDQWNIEGQWLYPRWQEGTLRAAEVLQPFNEHRIVWTHLLNLALFTANGQWDPLVQLVAIAVLRAGCAAGLLLGLARGRSAAWSAGMAVVVGLLFLPHLAWHNVLWGIESHAYFAFGFSLLTLALLGAAELSWGRTTAGLLCGIAGLFAMGPSALVPVALLGLTLLRIIEQRRITRRLVASTWPAWVLLALGLALRVDVPEHAALRAKGLGEFQAAAGRVLAWPHGGGVWVALVMNAPLLGVVVGRGLKRRTPAAGEDFVLLLGGWSAAIGLATAWVRGGSAELLTGVPSRYVDFIALLPVANVWCLATLAGETAARFRLMVRVTSIAWAAFLVAGWVGLSAEVMRGLVLPRARDREAPVRLAREFQLSGDARVFEGQPLLLVPHPNPPSILGVLRDRRMEGVLPPSFQPDKPRGPLSRGVRRVLGHQ